MELIARCSDLFILATIAIYVASKDINVRFQILQMDVVKVIDRTFLCMVFPPSRCFRGTTVVGPKQKRIKKPPVLAPFGRPRALLSPDPTRE